jgi:hypothetical protein
VNSQLYIPFVAAIIPLALGFVWYHKKVFGTAWIKAAEMTEDKAKGPNMAIVFGLTYLFSLLIAFALLNITIHQMHLLSLFSGEAEKMGSGPEGKLLFNLLMDSFGSSFRTFQHGAFHGAVAGFLIAMPILSINALFERRGFKYIAINSGFWILSMSLMGGFVCGFF